VNTRRLRVVKGPKILAVAAFALLSSLAAFAPGARQARDDDTPLMKEMEKLDAAMEFLKRSLRDPTQDARSLEQLAAAEQACLACKPMVPKLAASLPEGERPTLVTNYRKGMAALLIELLNLEVALLDGNHEQARALWKKLDAMKDEGHNEFTDGG